MNLIDNTVRISVQIGHSSRDYQTANTFQHDCISISFIYYYSVYS